jgi:hypothetical protein
MISLVFVRLIRFFVVVEQILDLIHFTDCHVVYGMGMPSLDLSLDLSEMILVFLASLGGFCSKLLVLLLKNNPRIFFLGLSLARMFLFSKEFLVKPEHEVPLAFSA